MCGRYMASDLPEPIIDALGVDPSGFNPREEVFPTNRVHVAFRPDDANEITEMTWGWNRSFSKRPLINTRGHEAWDKRTWRKAMRERRCIIPATGFYEWDVNQPKGSRDKYQILPNHEEGFAFGGLYEINKETGECFMSILTTEPNTKMEKIHHRMPVILNVEEFDKWFKSEDHDDIDGLMMRANDDWIKVTKDTST